MVRHPDRTIRMTICKREMRNRRAIRSLPFQDFAIRVEYVFHPFEDNVQIGEIDERWEHLDIALAPFPILICALIRQSRALVISSSYRQYDFLVRIREGIQSSSRR